MARSHTLLIISHTPHHHRDGVVVGWGPTVREIDQLATRFARVRHIACAYDEPAPESALAYAAANVEVVAVPPSGADGFLGKLDVLRTSPTYVKTILAELATADMVHVRAPANIALIAMLLLGGRTRPLARWFKYAGNWNPLANESRSYTFQRWWLKRAGQRGLVTVNGDWPDQPAWVRPFHNPSLDNAQIVEGRMRAAAKRLSTPLELLYVGQLMTSKGAGRALEILAQLLSRGIDARLDLIGGGDERSRFETRAGELAVTGRTRFCGWQRPAAVHEAYARAHFLLLPSASEGWPKVLSEGMAYGVVPLAGAVSTIPQYLTKFRTGVALPPNDIQGFASAIERYVATPDAWTAESQRAVDAARWFTFDHYLACVDELLAELPLR